MDVLLSGEAVALVPTVSWQYVAFLNFKPMFRRNMFQHTVGVSTLS